MSKPAEKNQPLSVCDPVWERVRTEAEEMAAGEPILASFLYSTILNHRNFNDAVAYHLAQKLGNAEVHSMQLRELFDEAMRDQPEIGEATRADIVAYYERDPACHSYIQPLLYFKGFHALQAYRVAHWLWNNDRRAMALYLQSRISELFAVDIHPAARVGRGVFIDHATGIVIGETAVVEDDVSMLHGVTLGGTGKEQGDRHPKVKRGVLISVGAKVLGNIEIGEYSRIGAGSVVLHEVPAHCTAVGVPAKIVGCAGCDKPAHAMDHIIREEGSLDAEG
ncbi:serine O-acetyltransferase [Parvibaculum sp.]|uniref:serine O-acetyltransferase n=1 Tax=Parvibaculum sp. TaxID=2024848 RepID=UPI000C40F110|nr:serine O-acetyltransferase [Parvibaculum sp.]HAC59290.1 serine O-acetyltransferase [Rhodobiaceae bacterium]MAU60095.1 serine O-acetyltransferase [Parvibaculum sp.]MBO6669704.1 serine O-acetyltransferase [Parvibaculum sp.]MBO6693661.1 serine O-acetyltransferase [Parvibaculum sp.]MBO6716211.1 serine O-acetyltransferase [Parvibaculum sp.]